jgi:hypothetical protein
LPAIQYTARDVRIQRHLDRYGVSVRDLVWQTDNGGEIERLAPRSPLELCLLPPGFVDYYLKDSWDTMWVSFLSGWTGQNLRRVNLKNLNKGRC